MHGGGGRRSYGGNYTNPCITMHQPWASLLVYGIKRVEGRSWPAPIRGRLWIHAASKVPEEATIKAMENFYREIYAVDGITDIKFPENYPVSRLLGCVEVVGCVRGEELANWEAVPEGVRLEGLTDFCWLCEQPQKLVVPFEMRGYQRVYNLERKIYEAAVRGLIPTKVPMPVKFPKQNPLDPFSLKPGSIVMQLSGGQVSEIDRSSSLTAAIAGARAAANQFKKDSATDAAKSSNVGSSAVELSEDKYLEEDKPPPGESDDCYNQEPSVICNNAKSNSLDGSSDCSQMHTESKQHPGGPAKIFAAAVRGLKP